MRIRRHHVPPTTVTAVTEIQAGRTWGDTRGTSFWRPFVSPRALKRGNPSHPAGLPAELILEKLLVYFLHRMLIKRLFVVMKNLKQFKCLINKLVRSTTGLESTPGWKPVGSAQLSPERLGWAEAPLSSLGLLQRTFPT